jgi:hypothetical protein
MGVHEHDLHLSIPSSMHEPGGQTFNTLYHAHVPIGYIHLDHMEGLLYITN